MAEDEDSFEPRLGRMRSRKGGRTRRGLQSLLIARIARAGGGVRSCADRHDSGRQSGRFNVRGRGARLPARPAAGSGWSVDPVSRMRVRARRVMVKARVVKLSGAKAVGAARSHLRYLQRDGVTREGEQGRFYSTFSDDADGKAFLARGEGDRHQFRFIVSPEDGPQFDTLRSFTRELMMKMEQDLGTTLDWVAVDHFDTGHPHTHVLVRGVTEDGKVLNIAGDYIAHGVRGRASEIMTRWLGPQSELEVREQLAREVDAERLTKLDRDILARAEDCVVDLRHPAGWDGDGTYQQLRVSRMRQLERMDLAEREGALVWRVDPDLEKSLVDLGRRGDIIRTMHQAMMIARLDRRPELYVIDGMEGEAAPVVGRVVHRGAAGDHHDRRYLVIDGVDGRTHYVDIGRNTETVAVGSVIRVEPVHPEVKPSDRTIDEVARANSGIYGIDVHLAHDRSATEDYAEAHMRRLEALRRAGAGVERLPDGSWTIPPDYLEKAFEHERKVARSSPARIAVLSRNDLEQEGRLAAPSWLDRQLKGEEPFEVADLGYGREVRRALALRQQWLVAQGCAELGEGGVRYRGDMDVRLRQAEVRTAAMRLSKELGLEFAEAVPGERTAGIVGRRVDLSSGSFAVIQRSKEFTLVPWRPVLERRLGREVSGIMRDSGAISWSFGRERSGPQIGL